MKLSKRQGQFLQKVITRWQMEGTVSSEEAEKLSNSYTIHTFNWKKLAKYSFWIAIVCALISVSAIVADDYIIHFIEQIFSSSNLALCLALGALGGLFYFLGLRGRKRSPEREFSNEALIFIGALFTAGSIAYLGRALDNGSGHYSILFLLATFIYGILGLWFPSRMVWVLALLCFGAWYGTEIGYQSKWSDSYLGMTYPLTFVFFGFGVVAMAFIFKYWHRFASFYQSTLKTGLIYLFVALWILSVFGNYDFDKWETVKQSSLIAWDILFGVVALICILFGIKTDDPITRGFGITFLFINLYTRYFEYFWNNIHKAIFFLILAVSFGIIGRWAERIWNIGKQRAGGPMLATDDIVEDEEE